MKRRSHRVRAEHRAEGTRLGLVKRASFAFLAVVLPISTLAVVGLVPGTSAIAFAGTANQVISVDPQAAPFTPVNQDATITADLSSIYCHNVSSLDVYFGELTATPTATATCNSGVATFDVTIPPYTGTQPSRGGVTVEVGLFDTSTNSFITTPNPPEDQFTYGPPTITNVTPSTGATGTSTNPKVTVTGSGFDSDTPSKSAFFFIPATATQLTPSAGTVGTTDSCSSTTQCLVTPPDLTTPGTYLVMAETEGTTALTSSATPSPGVNEYTVEPAPTVTSVTPGSGTDGSTVTVDGTSFSGATEVDLYERGKLSAQATPSNISSGSLEFTVLSGLSNGTYAVSVTTPYGSSLSTLSNADAFTVGPPSVTSVAPSGGPAGTATSVTVGGSGFDVSSAGTTFYFLPSASSGSLQYYEASSVTCSSPTSCTMDTPTLPAGVTTVVAQTDGGMSSKTGESGVNEYTFGNAPSISSIDPAAIPTTGTWTVLVSGTSLSNVTSATLTAVASTDGATLSSPAPAQTISDVSCSNSGTSCTLTFTPSSSLANTEDLLRLSGQDGGSSSAVSSADLLTIGPPVVTGVTPSGGPTSGGTSVTVTGYGFDIGTPGNTVFYFGSPSTTTKQTSTANSTSNCSLDTTTYEFSCSDVTDPAVSSPGVVTVVAETEDNGNLESTSTGTRVGVNEFSYAAQPMVTAVSPDSGSEGSSASVSVSGTGFVPGNTEFCFAPAGVQASSCPSSDMATTVSVSSTSSSASMGAPPESAGTVTVYAITYGDVYSVSNPPGDEFTYGAPSITSISPDAAPAGTNVHQSAVTVSGSGFALGQSTIFEFTSSGTTTPATSVNCTSTTVCSVVPPDEAAGIYEVTAATSGGTSSAVSFTYELPPSISGVIPNAQVSGNSVTVSGTGFTDDTTFTLTNGGSGDYGTTGSVDCISSTNCSFTVPSSTPSGTYDVVASTLGGSSPVVQPGDELTVGRPAISEITPRNGSLYGGNVVTVVGSGFQTEPSVTDTTFTFTTAQERSLTATPQSCVSDNSVQNGSTVYAWQCEVVMPSASTMLPTGGFVTVSARTDDGGNGPTSGKGTVSYDFMVPPVTLSAVSPDAGAVAGGTEITLTGSGLTNGDTTFTFTSPNDQTKIVSATGVTCNASGTSCTLETPAGSDGPGSYTITATDSLSPNVPSNGLTFYYNDPPSIFSVDPGSAAVPASGSNNVAVTVVGANLDPQSVPASFSFGGIEATGVACVASGERCSMTVDVPSDVIPSGEVNLTVNVYATTTGSNTSLANPDHEVSGSVDGDQFTFGPPTVTSVDPPAGSTSGGTRVTVTGSGFDPFGGTEFYFGGKPATNVNCVSTTSCTMNTPDPSSGPVSVEAMTDGGASAPLSDGFTYNPPPVVESLSSDTGLASGGEAVTVSGQNFIVGSTSFEFVQSGTTKVIASVNSVACTSSTSCSFTTPSVTIPSGQANLSTEVIAVTTGGNVSSPNPPDDVFTFGPPTVTGVVPAAGPRSGGEQVTISGSGFALGQGTMIDIGPYPLSSVSCSSTTECIGTTSSSDGVERTFNVYATTVGGTSAANPPEDDFTYGPPSVASVTPTAGPLSGGTDVVITGEGFVQGSTVYFGSLAATSVTFVSSTKIEAVSPGTSSAGAVDVTVKTLGGRSPIEEPADLFTYGAPSVTGVIPTAGPVSGGNTVTISGSGFTTDSEVYFGTSPVQSAIVSYAPNQMKVIAPPGTLGPVDVTVENPVGSSVVSSADVYVYGNPVVKTVTPNAGPTAGGTSVTILGSGFTANSIVDFGTTVANSVTVVSDTEIMATSPAGTGVVNVSVTTPAGSSASSTGSEFSYGLPSVTSVTPNQGPTSGGTTVTIDGVGFGPHTSVAFGQVGAVSVTYVSPTEIEAVTPAESPGSVDVIVTNSAGSSQPNPPADFFTFGPAPTVTALQPGEGPSAGGTVVTISGSSFQNVTAVDFGSVAASYTVVSTSEIQAIAPSGTGTVNVTVTASGFPSAINPLDQYTYVLPNVADAYHPISPVRIADTRISSNPNPYSGDTLKPDGTLVVKVAGVDGIPETGVTAVVANITAVDPTANGYLTVFPEGKAPLASNVNFVAGAVVPNLVEVQLSPAGIISIYNGSSGTVNVIVDVEGYVSEASAGTGLFEPIVPTRVADTRPGSGEPYQGQTLAPYSTLDVQVAGVDRIPASGIEGVVMNVTVTEPSAAGYLTVYPAGESLPLVSNLNFVAGQTVPNRVFVELGSDGQVAFYNGSDGTVDIVVDVNGWFTDGTNPSISGGQFTAMSPVRIVDTRPNSGEPYAGDTLGPNQTLSVQVAGVAGVPGMNSSNPPMAVVANVTVTNTVLPPGGASWLTAYPDIPQRPLASDLNWVGGQTVANLVVVKIGPNGAVNFYNFLGDVDVVVDVFGWYSSS